MEKKELYRYVGSMQQLAGIRRVTFQEGRSRGMQAWQVKNGPLQFLVMADKCLDVGELTFKGMQMNFLSKPGLQGRGHYDTNGQEALRSIMGGFFFTAGLENICAPCRIKDKDYPMHGRIRTTPGEGLKASGEWAEGRYVMRISGEMREAELFGENLVLRRSIETVYGEKSFTVTDEIENEGFRREPAMILYHINMGYPFLDENMRLYIPTEKVTPRDEESKGHEKNFGRMDPPKDGEPEYVFIHEMKKTAGEFTSVLAVNEKLGLGLKLEYTHKTLPYFMEWKSTASGDYVIGLEPSNSSVYGRPFHEKEKTVPALEPFEKKTNRLRFTILDGAEEIEQEIKKYEEEQEL